MTPRDDPPTIARVTPRDDPPTIARVTPRDDPPTAVRKARYRGRPTASRKARRAVSQRGQGQRRAPEPWRLESRRRARAELARLEANIREFEASQPEPAKAVLEAHEPAHWHHHAGDDVWCDEEHSGDEEVHVYRSCDAWGCRVDEVVVLRVE